MLIFIQLLALAAIIFFIYKACTIIYNSTTDSPKPPEEEDKQAISFQVSYEFEKVERNYPLFDSTKIPITIYCIYKVRGKNPATNRMKTNSVVAKKGTPSNIITLKSKLLRPYTVTEYFEEPTILQADYAKNLNIKYGPTCSKTDISYLIDRQLNGDFKNYISNDIREYAAENNVYISPYADKIGGCRVAIASLPPKERIVFFIYLIYCGIVKIPVGNLYNVKDYLIFYQYLETVPDIEELGKFIKEHYTDRLARVGEVDRRNKQMVQLYDSIRKFLIVKMKIWG